MSIAEQQPPKADGGLGGLLSKTPWPNERTFERMARAPSGRIPLPGQEKIPFTTDRVRAKPAVSPSLSMNIGVTAVGLGLWGTLFPNSVKKFLGIQAPAPVVQAVFGARELWTGFTLAGDPTKS